MMQPLGQISAAAVGWCVLVGISRSRGIENLSAADLSAPSDHVLATIDIMWRIVVAVGALPALLATLWRFSIPESPRFTMYVDRDIKRALADMERYRKKPLKKRSSTTSQQDPVTSNANGTGAPSGTVNSNANGTGASSGTLSSNTHETRDSSGIMNSNRDGTATSSGIALPNQNLVRRGPANNASDPAPTAPGTSEETDETPSFHEYLIQDGNIRYLFATAFCWFLLDFAFYGLGINSPPQLGQIWAGSYPANMTLPSWEDPYDSNTILYWQLFDSIKEYMFTICFGSLAGSIVLFLIIDKVPRKGFLIWSFVGLSVLFAAIAGLIEGVDFKRGHWTTVVFYALCQFVFNLGNFSMRFVSPDSRFTC